MARTGVATEPFPVNNQADVIGTLNGQGAKFWPPCACLNHADSKNCDGFLVLGPNCPGTKEIYLHYIPWLWLVLIGYWDFAIILCRSFALLAATRTNNYRDNILNLKSKEDLGNGLVSPGSTRVNK
eukprot:9793549-Ditylum_brightwellii.AAC.1